MAFRCVLFALMATGHAHWLPFFWAPRPMRLRQTQVVPLISVASGADAVSSAFSSGKWGCSPHQSFSGLSGKTGGWLLYLLDKSGLMLFRRYTALDDRPGGEPPQAVAKYLYAHLATCFFFMGVSELILPVRTALHSVTSSAVTAQKTGQGQHSPCPHRRAIAWSRTASHAGILFLYRQHI